jgi:hypothetical protein
MKIQLRIGTSWTGFSFTKAIARPHLRFWCALLGTLVGFEQAGAQTPNFVLSCSPDAGPVYYVAVADVNGDGKPDLICVDNMGEPVLVILTNNGSGGFGLNAEIPIGSGICWSVAVADVNGDGKPDLICANGSTLTVLTNNGSGGFGFNTTLNVGGSPAYVTAADVNGDGEVDLISANWAGTLTVLTNNGSGGFGSNATLSVGSNPRSVVAADMNGDGKVDLISANWGDGTLTVLTNNGSGIFGSNATLNVGGYPCCVTVADVNGDGKPDLICANEASLIILTNNGSGGFGSNATLNVLFPVFVVAADVNGDGKPDLICASPIPPGALGGDNTLTIFTNDGSGGFGFDGKLATGGAPFSVAAADVNGDGQLDLICPSLAGNGGTIMVFTNTIIPGHTGFSLISSPGVGANPFSVIAVDVNGDCKLDLISANAGDNTLTVLTNNGNGFFGSNATLNVGSIPACVVAADVNGDGKPDLICGNWYDGTLTVFTNNGSGGFGSNATLSAGAGPLNPYPVEVYSIAAVDVNGDGKPDLIRANYGGGSLTIWTNNGSGIFSSNATLYCGGWPRAVVVADVNGDGKPDLISVVDTGGGGLSNSKGLIVFTNNGSGGFGLNAEILSIGYGAFDLSAAVAVADVNGDGKPDLISATSGGYLTIWTNNGSGVFGSNATLNVGGRPWCVTAADVNGDGKPDLICANTTSVNGTYTGNLTLFTNNGSGTFGLYATLAVGSAPYCVVAADVNGDGRLDLITANSYDNNLSVLFNVPWLDIGLATNTINMVWPFPSSGFVLQQNSDLGTTNWVNVTNAANFVGGQNQVLIPPSAGNDFFRLYHP